MFLIGDVVTVTVPLISDPQTLSRLKLRFGSVTANVGEHPVWRYKAEIIN